LGKTDQKQEGKKERKKQTNKQRKKERQGSHHEFVQNAPVKLSL
jgi:hypothetical protein